ncbi:hypothetical protein CVS40_11617 [Lucilia cuprina]|nr:hypothetical protein CVS40_11617 [Lucilia cuprina]
MEQLMTGIQLGDSKPITSPTNKNIAIDAVSNDVSERLLQIEKTLSYVIIPPDLHSKIIQTSQIKPIQVLFQLETLLLVIYLYIDRQTKQRFLIETGADKDY